MGTKIGLWIDHRKSVIMFISDAGEETKLIISNVEKQRRRTGSSPLRGAFERIKFANDINRKRNFMQHLGVYIDSVIACIKDADSILILGPGEAKNELKRRMEESKLGDKISGIEATGLMTNGQRKSKIRNFFKEQTL